ncbi:hypothetical protein [Arthrobacter crystallopoietes]|uniref:hypothetical protein n=1 Tax=Crystallibacter crystallopoietes TaxID=37928 RepID=UPI001475EB94|nr:hypothetical protein [Arthrobacter crystallopoietes]
MERTVLIPDHEPLHILQGVDLEIRIGDLGVGIDRSGRSSLPYRLRLGVPDSPVGPAVVSGPARKEFGCLRRIRLHELLHLEERVALGNVRAHCHMDKVDGAFGGAADHNGRIARDGSLYLDHVGHGAARGRNARRDQLRGGLLVRGFRAHAVDEGQLEKCHGDDGENCHPDNRKNVAAHGAHAYPPFR